MYTVKHIIELVNSIEVTSALFGSTDDFSVEWHRRIQDIGKAICEERGIEYRSAAAPCIPFETKLGEKSSQQFSQLQDWLNSGWKPKSGR